MIVKVSYLYQERYKQSEIFHTFARFEEHYAVSSQLIVNLVHGIKRLHPSPIIRVDVDAALLLLFAKGTGYFDSRGVRRGWAGHADLAPLAKLRERVGLSELAVSIWRGFETNRSL